MKRLFIIVMLLLYIGCMASCGKEETNSDSGSMTTTVSEIITEASVSVDTVRTDTDKAVSEKADEPEKPKTTSVETKPDVSETADVEVTETDDYSIDGTWNKIRMEGSDGFLLEGDDIAAPEVFEISGDKGTYTADIMGKVKSWDITLEKTGEQRYLIKLKGKLELCEADFDGDTMFYTIDTGDEKDTFTFERQK